MSDPIPPPPPGFTIIPPPPPGYTIIAGSDGRTTPLPGDENYDGPAAKKPDITQRTADYIWTVPSVGPVKEGYNTSRGGFILNPMNPDAKPSGNITAFKDGRAVPVTVSPTLPKATYPSIIAREVDRTAKPYDVADHPEDVAAMSPGMRTLMNIGITGRMLGNTGVKLATGTAEALGQLDENPVGTLLGMAKGAATSPTATKETLRDFVDAAKAGDTKGMGAQTDRFITEAGPGLMGLEGGMRAGFGGIKAGADYVKAAPERAHIKSIDSLSTIIGPGTEGPPQPHAELTQPFVQQFFHEAGVDPRRVLPSGGSQPYLLQGGSAADLAAMNKALQAEWVRTGGKATEFVPATSVSMAMADGAVNVADRPISNAVRAVADRSVPEMQNSLVAKMRAKAKITPDAGLRSAMNSVADEIDASDGTMGAIDNLKAHFNKESGNFYRGTQSAQSEAMATSAYAYKYAADLIRAEQYPWLEANTTAKGLADAGRAQASAIAARDGIYKSYTTAAKLNASAGVQKFLDYITNGPETAAQAAIRPQATLTGIAGRAATLPFREMPLGRFNELLRNGIGDMRNFRPIDASVTATTAAAPAGYGRFRSQQGYTPTQGPTNQSAGDAIQAILNRPGPNPYGIDPNAPPTRVAPPPAGVGNMGHLETPPPAPPTPPPNPYGIDPSRPNVRPAATGNTGNAGALTGGRPPVNPYGIDPNAPPQRVAPPPRGPGNAGHLSSTPPPAPNPYGIDTGANVGSVMPAAGLDSTLPESLTASEAASSILKGGYSDLQSKLATPQTRPGASLGNADSLTMQQTADTGYPKSTAPQSGARPPRGGGSMNSLTAEPPDIEGEGGEGGEGGDGGEGGEAPAAPKPAPKKPAPAKPAGKKAAPKKAEAPAKPASGKPDLADLMSAKMLNMTIEEYMRTKKR